ncbi:MAG: hypothetical protein ACREE6_14135 [Limisphaerales bacterium]
MRTTQDVLEYIDRIIHIGVDKMEAHSQFALIEMQSTSEQDGLCDKVLVPLLPHANDREGMGGDGI